MWTLQILALILALLCFLLTAAEIRAPRLDLMSFGLALLTLALLLQHVPAAR